MPRPKQVDRAVMLLWLSLALAVPLIYLEGARDPQTWLHPAALIFMAVIFAIAAALNVLIYKGHNWARIVVLIFYVIGLISLLASSDEPVPAGAAEHALNVLTLVIDSIALYLLFTPPGSQWFRKRGGP
jgi:hypothetical protein